MRKGLNAGDFDNTSKSILEQVSGSKGGRPKKDPREKLTKRLQLSFTEAEWQCLLEKAEAEFRDPGPFIKLFLKRRGFFE